MSNEKEIPKFERKLPYVKITIEGTDKLADEIKNFLGLCLEWAIVEDVKPIFEKDLMVIHGLDQDEKGRTYEHKKSEFWLIQKGRLKK